MRGYALGLACGLLLAGCTSTTPARPVAASPATTSAPPSLTASPTPTRTPAPRRTTPPPARAATAAPVRATTPARPATTPPRTWVAPPPPTYDRYVAPTPIASKYVGCRSTGQNRWEYTYTVTMRRGEGWAFHDPHSGDTATYTRGFVYATMVGETPPAEHDYPIAEAYVSDLAAHRKRSVPLPRSLRLTAHCTQ
jgi:hypothetical protein